MNDTLDNSEDQSISGAASMPKADEASVDNNTSAAEEAASSADDEAETGNGKKKKRSRRRIVLTIVIIVVVVILILAALVVFFIYRGVLAPGNAAAKYDFASYVYEDEVDDYIDTYRGQMGFLDEDADDVAWATFLSQYNLTPAILREATIHQLIEDDLVYKKCEKLGITVDDEEVDAVIDAAKDSYAFGDEDTWNETLEMYGQTEEGYRAVIERDLLQRKLYSEEVEMPTPTDEEVDSYISSTVPNLDSNVVRHTYFFELSADPGEDSYDNLKAVSEVRKLFLEGEQTVDYFTYLVTAYSNNEDLIETGGANGWSVDTSSYDTAYIQQTENLSEGDVSTTFQTEDGYGFAWVDETYTFPQDSEKLATLTPEDMPESLWSYLSDCEAYQLWQSASSEYLEGLYDDAHVVIFGMPSDASYNVDMSLATDYGAEDTDEETDAGADADTSSDETTDSDAGSEEAGSEEETGEESG